MTPKEITQFDKIDHSLSKLLEELKDYSHLQLNKKTNPDSWSVLQIMHHMMLAEKVTHDYLIKKLSHHPKLKNAGIVTKLRSLAINSFLKSPLKAKAPVVLSGENLPEESSFWETAKQWTNQRAELRSYLESLPKETFKKEAFKHPMGGRISIYDALTFFEAHFYNHRKQIRKTLGR